MTPIVWSIDIREPTAGWTRLGKPSGNIRWVWRKRWMAKNSKGERAMFDRKRDAVAWVK